jgi:hypothetical protein
MHLVWLPETQMHAVEFHIILKENITFLKSPSEQRMASRTIIQ